MKLLELINSLKFKVNEHINISFSFIHEYWSCLEINDSNIPFLRATGYLKLI